MIVPHIETSHATCCTEATTLYYGQTIAVYFRRAIYIYMYIAHIVNDNDEQTTTAPFVACIGGIKQHYLQALTLFTSNFDPSSKVSRTIADKTREKSKLQPVEVLCNSLLVCLARLAKLDIIRALQHLLR